MESLLSAADAHDGEDTAMASGYQTPPLFGRIGGKHPGSGSRGADGNNIGSSIGRTMRPSPSMSMASPQMGGFPIDHGDEHHFMPTMELEFSPPSHNSNRSMIMSHSLHSIPQGAGSTGIFSSSSFGQAHTSGIIPSVYMSPRGGALHAHDKAGGGGLSSPAAGAFLSTSWSSPSSVLIPQSPESSAVASGPEPPKTWRGKRTLGDTEATTQPLFASSSSSSRPTAKFDKFAAPPTPPTPTIPKQSESGKDERGAAGKQYARGKSSASPGARRAGIKEGEEEDGRKVVADKEDNFGVKDDKPVHRKLRSGRTVYAENSSLDHLVNAAIQASPLPKLVTAVYGDYQPPQPKTKTTKSSKAKGSSPNLFKMAGGPKDGVVMSETRREWQSMLGNLSSAQDTNIIKGQVTALGSLTSKAGDQYRNLIVVRPVDKEVPRSEPLLRVDVRKLTDVGKAISCIDPVPMHESDSVGPPLARPCFSPFEAGRLALATEQHPLQESSGAVLIVTQVQKHPKAMIKLTTPSLFLPDAVSAMDWLSAKELLVASGKNLILVSLGESTLRNRLVLPSMHTDDIRDVQLSSFQRNMALSGGYDGKVYITDCEKVISDQMSYRAHSSNTLYDVGDATVSSVQWNPIVANFASITTDDGFLHCFDTRLGNEKPSVILKTGLPLLYTHGWSDSNGVLLGYGDGTLCLFDIRMFSQCVCSFTDPHVRESGDIVFDPQRRYFINFGSPGFSVWRNEASCISLRNTDLESYSDIQVATDRYYKQSGAFLLTGGRQHAIFGTTDAHGFFSLYDVMSSGDASIDIRTPLA